jgi:hypothetical protein
MYFTLSRILIWQMDRTIECRRDFKVFVGIEPQAKKKTFVGITSTVLYIPGTI